MIIMLTPTMLATDIIVAARCKIAQKLQLPVALVSAKWVRNDKGGLNVEFAVDLAQREMDISDTLIQTVVQTVWAWEYKRRMEWTLENVKGVRQ